MKNLYQNIPKDLPTELFETLIKTDNIHIERIVSKGHASEPGFWYDQASHEFVILVQGTASLAFEDRTIELTPGDYLTINPHQKHRVAWTDPDQPTLWLAIHY